MQDQQRQESHSKIEKSLSNLTHQLLKDYKIGTIPYIIIKIIEYLQLIYFVMRVENQYHWNFSIASYFSIFVNRIVVDSNLRLSPGIFQPLLYFTTSVLFLIIVFGVLIGTQAGWGVKMPLFVKILVPVLNILLFLFMTIITIPASQLIFVCFDKNTSDQLKIVQGGPSIILGTLLSIFFIIINSYTLIFYRQNNPFSYIHHSGRSVLKGLFVFLVKVLLSLYSILDIKGDTETLSNYLFTFIIICIICQSHYQIGLYRPFSRRLQIKLTYFVLVVGLLHSMDSLSSQNTQITTFSYLFPLCLIMHLISDSIERYLHQQNLLINVILNDSPQKFQKHIITLINLIQNMSQRQNRIELEGYLHIHRRQCRLGPVCSCEQLGIIRQRNQELIKTQYYKLVIVLLSENKRKFPNYYRIDLLLGLVYHFRLKNSLQAIYSFTKLTTDKNNTFLNRLFVVYYLRKVQEQMKQQDQKQVSSTNRINKFFQYTNKMVEFEEHVERCTKDHIQFWRLMLDNNPEIKRLEDLGTLITRNKDYLKEQFDNIFEKNSNSVCLLTIYGKFLLEVTNEENYNVKYLEKAQSILKNIKQSSKIEEAGGKYTENADTCVVIISGNDGQLGKVIHTNNTVKKLLGYRKNQLIGRNVASIMPKIYGDSHNAILTRYIRASESKVNGHERVVPALTKEGFILPATALTKALPTLAKGIQIVGFLAKMQYKVKDDEEVQSNVSYLLYRTDTEEIVGISQGCYEQYHIHTSLIYGNTNNINNQLKVKNLFGVSFQKDQDGRIATALQIGQVEMMINTTSLKEQFIISKIASNDDIDYLVDENDTEGVQRQVIGKNILTTVYCGITLKLLAFYPKKVKKVYQKKLSRRSNSYTMDPYSKKKLSSITKGSKFFQQNSKTQTDDMKNLKDFKNFISIKNQPSAISVLSTICILFILLMCSSIIGLIVNWFKIKQINQDMLKSVQLSLYTELATPQIMTQVQKQILALTALNYNITNFTSYEQSNNKLLSIVKSTKDWQLSLLPYKYKFNSKYMDQMAYYSLSSLGKISKTSQFIEESIFDYISQIQTISLTNLSALSDFQTNLQSNTYQKYASAKINQVYSIRQALNSSNTVQWNSYKDAISSKNNLLIILCSIMMGGICLWLVLLLPYVLSVTRINNRVLSLFSLIPYGEVCKLIYGCLTFMSNNLLEADISNEDLKFYQNEQNQKIIQPQLNSPASMNSPSQLGLFSDLSYTQSNIIRKSQMIDRLGRDSMIIIEQKFEKMINSEDRNKKMVIFKFVGISLLILGFVLFFLFYSMQILSSASASISYYQLIGRRPALMRNTKLLITEYLLNPSYSPLLTDSIKKINLNLISQFYNLQASLLSLNLNDLSSSFNDYNNGDICSKISQYSAYSLFNESLSREQCYGVGSNILQKGIKTGIVSVLQSIRSIVSQYNSAAPKIIIASYIKMFDSLTKYIETPMLSILNLQNKNLTNAMQISNIIVITSGVSFIICLLLCWKIIWGGYLSQLNIKIWRTKGLLNLIPMRIITSNDLLKNQFTSGQLEKAVR